MNIIVDTNLLLLYFVGIYDPKFIEYCDRISKYTISDFHKVRNLINFHKKIFITPQVLAELSNFSFQQIKEPKLSIYLNILITRLKLFNEKYISMRTLLTNVDLLKKIGFTDLSIMETAKVENCRIFTDDFELSQRAFSIGLPALNFANWQGKEWDIT